VARLRERLAERRVNAVEAASPVEAMAEICLQERAQRARSAWGLQRSMRSALVVVDRGHWRDLSPMLDAIDRHLPEASVWMCDERVALEIHPKREGPKLRLAGTAENDDVGEGDPAAAAVRTRLEATLRRSERRVDAPEPGPTSATRSAAAPVEPPGSALVPRGETMGAGEVSMSSSENEHGDAGEMGLDAAVSAEELAMLLREEDSL